MDQFVTRDNNRIVFGDRITGATVRSFLSRFYAAHQKQGYEFIELDFAETSRAYPDGIVPIICQVSDALKRGIGFRIIPPKDQDLETIFQRSGWLHHLSPAEYDPPRQLGFSSLPLQCFATDTELNDVVSRAVEVCLQQLVLEDGVPQAFEWALNEVAGNVLVHSEANCGWLQIVTFRDNHHLSLVVCDSGIGIPASMKQRFQFDGDKAGLELAIQKGVTSKPDFGQGNGLAGTLAIAQNSEGSFSIMSQRAQVWVLEGRVSSDSTFPPYPGTSLAMGFSTDRPIDLPAALGGHKPVDYMELKFEDEKGDLQFRLKDYASSFGNRITGARLRTLVLNLLKQNPGHAVEIRMDDVGVIASSFADELFGKLFIELGPTDFSQLLKIRGVNSLCKSLIDLSISQRVVQSMTANR